MKNKMVLAALAGLLVTLLAGCNSIGPSYSTKSALDGVVAGEPRPSKTAMLPPKALTVGLIATDATEATFAQLADLQKALSASWRPEQIRRSALFHDPNRYVVAVVEMLKTRYGRVELIPDMNALASLPQPAIACVFDLRLSGMNDITGQRPTGTSEMWFLDGDGAVLFSVQGRVGKHLAGGSMGRAATAQWMTLSTTVMKEAIEDMQAKLDAKLGFAP